MYRSPQFRKEISFAVECDYFAELQKLLFTVFQHFLTSRYFFTFKCILMIYVFLLFRSNYIAFIETTCYNCIVEMLNSHYASWQFQILFFKTPLVMEKWGRGIVRFYQIHVHDLFFKFSKYIPNVGMMLDIHSCQKMFHLRFTPLLNTWLLHLRKIVEGLYFHYSLSCVCVSLSVCLSVNTIPAERMHWFWRSFHLMVANRTGSNPLVTLSQRSWSQWCIDIPFFLHNSLLTSLLCISGLWCPIKIELGMSLRYALGRFVLEFH